MHNYLKGGCQKDGARLSSVVPGNTTKGNRHKLKHKTVHLSFFTVRMSYHWKRLPRKVAEFPPLENFKSHLDTIPRNVLYLTLCKERGWTK